MSTLTIHPADLNQETAIRLFLDALHVDYNTTEKKSAAMKAQLDNAAKQEENGEGVKSDLDDIWK